MTYAICGACCSLHGNQLTPLHRPTSQTSGKMASFSATLDFAEEEESSYWILQWRRRRRWRKRLWSVRPINRSGQEQGNKRCVRVDQMREMNEERHFQYFRMSKYHFDDLLHWTTPCTQHQNTHSNPAGVLQRTAVVLRILASGSSQQCVAAVASQSHPSCEPIFFSTVSRVPFHLRVMIEHSVQSTNQNMIQIKTTSVTLQVLTCKTLLDNTFLCLFYVLFVFRHRWQTPVFGVWNSL